MIHLELTGRLAYEDDITIAQATLIIAFLNGGPGIDAAASVLETPASPSVDKTKPRRFHVDNPRDALDVSGARTNAEKIVALGAYVLQDGELDTFTLDSIRPLFHRAREVSPKNLTRDRDVAIRSGWIGEGHAKDEFYLTAKAERVLETGFDSIRPNRSGNAKSRNGGNNNKSRNASRPAAFAEIDTFPTVINGLPAYHHINLKRDKMLWAINCARDEGVSGLQNKEIMWLTDNLGDGIPSNDIAKHFRFLQKKGYANRSIVDNAIRITDAGEAHLRTLTAPSDDR